MARWRAHFLSVVKRLLEYSGLVRLRVGLGLNMLPTLAVTPE